jgi:hypothetical protein
MRTETQICPRCKERLLIVCDCKNEKHSKKDLAVLHGINIKRFNKKQNFWADIPYYKTYDTGMYEANQFHKLPKKLIKNALKWVLEGDKK